MVSTKNFKQREFECSCGCGTSTPAISLLILLEMIRAHFGLPVIINSGCRCHAHNEAEGGADESRHLPEFADGADIRINGVTPEQIADYLESLPFADLLGIGLYNGRVHVDTRGWRARWDCR